MPSDQPNFRWRIRCHARFGINLPLSDVIQGESPSCYIEFSWSDSDLNLEDGKPYWQQSDESVKTNFVQYDNNPVWNQLVLLHNPKSSFDTKNGFLII